MLTTWSCWVHGLVPELISPFHTLLPERFQCFCRRVDSSHLISSHCAFFLLTTFRRFTTWQMWPASVTVCRVPAAWRPAGSSWLTLGESASSWRRSTTAPPPCAWDARSAPSPPYCPPHPLSLKTTHHLTSIVFPRRVNWSWWTSALTPRPRKTWSTSTRVLTTATATRARARWARRAVTATRRRRAWTAASSCAAAEATTSSRRTSTSAATASSTGAATSSASAARRSSTSLYANSTGESRGESGGKRGKDGRRVSRVFVPDDSSLPRSAVRLCGQFYIELERNRQRRGTRGGNTDFLPILFGKYIPNNFLSSDTVTL